VISGNVSLYNATGSKSIYPTPMIGMVGVVQDIRQATPATVQNETDLELYELRLCTYVDPELAVSLVGKISSISPDHGRIAEIDWTQEKLIFKALDFLRSTGELLAARSISEGGLGVAVIKMLSKLIRSGFDLEILPNAPKIFFGEGGSRFLVYIKSGRLDELKLALKKMGVELSYVASARRRSELDQRVNGKELFGDLKTYFGRLSLKDVWLAYNSFIDARVN
jgi:phosphoribosylformylglycinamidine synthase